MGYFVITAFDGTTLVTTGRDMVAMNVTAPVISRVGYLENGVKFDADGAADSDVGLGQVTATYRLRSTANGMTTFNNGVAALTLLRGKVGTLTGVERMSPSDVVYTCTARCIDVIQEEYRLHNNPPMHASRRQSAQLTVVWEMLTGWTT